MQIKGLDLSQLGDQFKGHGQGRTLILDGDGPCYVAAATVKTLSTAVSKVQSMILGYMFLAGAQDARVHLTAMDSKKAGRGNIIATKPYQGNRKGKAKPPLLEATRQAVANPANWLSEFEVIYHTELEADDGMIHDAYRLQEHGVIRSEDKDLRMTPYNYWDIKQGRIIVPGLGGFGSLHEEFTGAGQHKCVGYGRKFFWAQMLMGDTADNVAGIKTLYGKLCGSVGAYQALQHFQSEDECANYVLDHYRAINQNPLAEGWLLWLQRRPQDTFWQYCSELALSKENKEYLLACSQREWFKKPEPIVEEDDGDF